MSRIALYRKYRSADFGDVVGQQHVTRTLEAAVQRGLMSHAYLLTGPRGTGKTSIARILARRINELPVEADLGRELDIIEIDAASNRGIDEMRSLREKIMSAPTHLKYKVYIIDEVHMLTKEAFNALLKTLEEPPAHAIFVLATTEAHKLPETIISRTQRFDLRPIGEADLVARLGEIAKLEGIDIDAAALSMIAHASRGGFRDAISLLDQLSTLDEKLGVAHVSAMLGMAAREDIDALLGAVAQQDTTKVFTLIEHMIALGNEPQSLTRQLLDALRGDLLGQVGAKPTKSSFGMDLGQLTLAVRHLTKALADFKITSHYSLPLEIALYELCQPTIGVRAPQPQSTGQATQEVQQSPVAKASTDKPAAAKTQRPVAQVVNVDAQSLCMKGLSLIKERNNSLYAVIRSANPRIEDDRLVMECPFSFHKERIEEQKNRQLIEQIMSKTFGQDIVLDCRLSQPKQTAEPVDSQKELVASALEILGGEVVSG